MVVHFVIFLREKASAILACFGGSVTSTIDIGHGDEGDLFRHDFSNNFVFRHHVIIKVGHDSRAAVQSGRSLVLRQTGYAVTAKPAYHMLVNDMGFCIGMGVLLWRSEKTFKITDEIKFWGCSL